MLAEYYNHVNSDLLEIIPPDAGTILEIGCGGGALGRAVKRINPAAYYIGIEANPAAAREASRYIDRVLNSDVEQLELESLTLADGGSAVGQIDCLVYCNVLENLVDPWKVLKRHTALLAPGGVVVACIPNVQHWSVISELLRGKWEYQNDGLLDRTHLRFFSSEGIESLFEQAELRIFEVRLRRHIDDQAVQFQQSMKPILESLGIDQNIFDQQTATVQYLVRALRIAEQPQRLLLQTLMLKPQAAVNDVRIKFPNRFVGTVPGVRVMSMVDRMDLGISKNYADKVLIWQRPVMKKEKSLIKLQRLVNSGYLVINEIDDYPFFYPEMAQHGQFTFAGVHALQTSTEVLAGVLRQYNPNVGVFPNQLIELPDPRMYDDDDEDDKVAIFFGALNRKADWQSIMPALNVLLSEYGQRVSVNVVYDRDFFDALATNHKTFEPMCGYDRYQAILRGNDIALLPLADTLFNRCKSDLKFLECAGQGVAVLASPTVYKETIEDGETGLLFDSEDSFLSNLRILIEDTVLRRAIAARAYDYVKKERLLAHHYRKRLAWYQSLLLQLPDLNAQLGERMPEIFSS